MYYNSVTWSMCVYSAAIDRGHIQVHVKWEDGRNGSMLQSMLGCRSSWNQFKVELNLKPVGFEPQLVVIFSTPLLTSTRHLSSDNMKRPRRITKDDIYAFAPPAHQKYMMKVGEIIVKSRTNEKRRIPNMLYGVSRLQSFPAVFVKANWSAGILLLFVSPLQLLFDQVKSIEVLQQYL